MAVGTAFELQDIEITNYRAMKPIKLIPTLFFSLLLTTAMARHDKGQCDNKNCHDTRPCCKKKDHDKTCKFQGHDVRKMKSSCDMQQPEHRKHHCDNSVKDSGEKKVIRSHPAENAVHLKDRKDMKTKTK